LPGKFRRFVENELKYIGGLIYAVNGPDLYGRNIAVKGFAIGITSQQLVSTFAPPSGTFNNPHDLAVSYDGKEVYVVELNPHKVWKFVDSRFTKIIVFLLFYK